MPSSVANVPRNPGHPFRRARRLARRSSFIGACLLSTACATTTAAEDEQKKILMPPPKDISPELGEAKPVGEDAAVRTITETITGAVKAQHAKEDPHSPMTRDAHAKHHGCVKASFTVNDGLPGDLRVGMFRTPKTYPAWIRYSNGSGKGKNDDHAGDGRGMAIKVMNVPGMKILDGERDEQTQDFLMINYPAFFVRDAIDYVSFSRISAVEDPPKSFFAPGLNLFRWRWHELGIAKAIQGQRVNNMLALRYFSMTPYAFGQTPSKYSARPCADAKPSQLATYGDDPSPNFLRKNLSTSLGENGACFDFAVQLRNSHDADMPVEDPTIVWDEAKAPYRNVARVVIPPQRFDSDDQQRFCENLSYTPWHSLPEHRPLGGINRVRKAVYEAVSKLRHATNQAPRREPRPWTESETKH